MHIAFLTPEYSRDKKPEGGLANYLYKVSRELTFRGHRVSVFCLSKENKYWQDQGISVYEVKHFTFPSFMRRLKWISVVLPCLAQIRSASLLEKVVWRVHSRNKIDILQASSYKSPGFTLLGNSAIPIVCRISSYAPLFRSAGGRRRNLSEYFCDWLEVRQVLDSSAAFAPSKLMADTYFRLEGFAPKVIRTPIEIQGGEWDYSIYNEVFAERKYLLYFGTLKPVKGVDLLADVISPILTKYPDFSFAFVGRDDGLRSGQKIFDYILKRNTTFSDKLIYHPALPKTQLYPIVANAHGVVMPSRVDNLPNACLEAMSLGVPVVGTYQSSLDEMIIDGKTGFLAENNSSDSIRVAIECLLSLSTEQREQMKTQICQSVEVIRSEDRVGQLIEFYCEEIEKFKSVKTA